MEIKCRAWDNQENIMIEHNSQELVFIPCLDNLGADRHFKHDDWGDIDISHFDWASADLIGRRYKLMLYTGLRDKNSQEAYHHDLVRDKEGLLWEIEWGSGRFYFVSREKNIRPDGSIAFMGVVEIIGNRFENPELMEQDNGS